MSHIVALVAETEEEAVERVRRVFGYSQKVQMDVESSSLDGCVDAIFEE